MTSEYSHDQWFVKFIDSNYSKRSITFFSKIGAMELAVMIRNRDNIEVAVYQQKVTVSKPRCIRRLK